MRSLTRELFAFDDGPATAGETLYFRLLELFTVGFALKFCWTWAAYTQQIEAVLLPLGLANYIDVSFMFDHGLSLVNAGLVTFFCALGFARLWRPAYLAAFLLFHLQYVARYCLGEISHGSNLIGMGVLGLALAALVFGDPTLRRRFTMGFLYFFIGLGYTSAAICKLVGTGLFWPDGRHLWMWIAERQVDTISKLGAFSPNVVQQLVLWDYHVGTVVLTFGLLAELFGVLMWWRRFRYPVVLTIVGMHIGIAISMNIFFDASTYFLILLGLPWPVLIDCVLRQHEQIAARLAHWRFLSA